MSKKYHEYANYFKDTDNKVFSGISYPPNLLAYSNYFKEYEIAPEEEYRPDKISFELWGVEDLSWVLDVINDFTNGISEYTRYRKIKYLSAERLVNLGIL